MSGEISMTTGIVAEALPSPVVASSNRFNSQRSMAPTETQSTPETAVTQQPKGVEGTRSSAPEENQLLDVKPGQAQQEQQALMAHNASLSFERDQADGKMYLYVKDKLTGEEIYRIPKNYLKGTDLQQRHDHKVDVHI